MFGGYDPLSLCQVRDILRLAFPLVSVSPQTNVMERMRCANFESLQKKKSKRKETKLRACMLAFVFLVRNTAVDVARGCVCPFQHAWRKLTRTSICITAQAFFMSINVTRQKHNFPRWKAGTCG